MQARGEIVGHDREGVRRQMRGRLQCGADIPAMDGEFKDARVDHGVHRKNATRMIAGLVPIMRGEGDDTLMELVPGVTKCGHQVVAKTLAERDGALGERRRPLPPFLPREGFDEVGRWETCWRGRGIPPQSTGDAVRIRMRYRAQMRHDIPEVPEGTGAGLRPGVRW